MKEKLLQEMSISAELVMVDESVTSINFFRSCTSLPKRRERSFLIQEKKVWQGLIDFR
jgi:hypothetical protein